MRKILLSISIILLVSQDILAQEIYVAPVIGTNATFANLSKVMKDYYKSITLSDGDAEATVTSKFPPTMGFQLGGLVSYSIGAISLQSGLLITRKGFSIKRDGKGKDPSGNAFSISGKSTMSIFYLEIPLWASYEIGESGIKISAGPSFGLAIGGKTKVKLNQNGSSTTESSKLSIGSNPYSDNVEVTDFNVNLGIGKEIELGGKTLDLTLFAQPSISTWNPSAKLNKDFGARHFTTGIRAAYYFQIK